jgi:phosphoribosylaminoimidazolecarboxamide formyltransferase/IMP cyclohydrolase
MMDGRVKTLHPASTAVCWRPERARRTPRPWPSTGIAGIDLLYSTLYPFEDVAAGGGAFEAAVENIDMAAPR